MDAPDSTVTPDTGDNRTQRVTIRFTEAEIIPLRLRVQETASQEMADYIRRVVLGRKVRAVYRNRSMDDFIQELSLLRRELNAIGKNFNQVTKKVNATAGKKEFGFWVKQAALMQETLLEKIEAIRLVTEKFASQWYANSSPANGSGGQ